MENGSENRLRVVAALAVLREGEGAAMLTDYMSDEEKSSFATKAETFLHLDERDFRAQQFVRQMVAQEKFTSLAEIHPAWILERLKEESPRIIGIILRALPSRHVSFILKNMPPMLRAQVPHVVESFAVAAPILEVVRKRFERHFLPMRVSKSTQNAGFENLYYLKEDELRELIRDVGLTELAMALSGLPGKTLVAVYNRLDIKDAKSLKRKVGEVKGNPHELFRQARATILEVDGLHIGPEKMLVKIGLAALAKAVDSEHETLVRLLQQRLSPAEGYLLKRFIDERRMRVNSRIAEIRRNLVLDSIVFLAKEGRIDPFWKGLFSGPENVPSETPETSLKTPLDEETSTVQLA